MIKKLIKLFFTFFLLVSTIQLAHADVTNLDVNSCTHSAGGTCSASNLNSDTTSIGISLAKNENAVTGWTDISTGVTINSVTYTLRHDGANADLDGSWSITFQTVGGGTTYCTINEVHVLTDTTVTPNISSCGLDTPGELNDLEIVYVTGDTTKPSNAYVYYSDLSIDYSAANSPPSWSGSISDSPDPVNYSDAITYSSGTQTDPDSDNYYLTVCGTNVINDGAPGTCEGGQTLCTSTSTSSGSSASCDYTTDSNDIGTLTAYGFLCDVGSSTCSASTSTTTTVNNNAPTISSGPSDSPDPVLEGNDITYSVTANDNDGDTYRLLVCTTNGETNGVCDGTQVCVDSYQTSGTESSCTYTAQVSDAPTKTVYAFTCDSLDACTSGTELTTTVNTYTDRWAFNLTDTSQTGTYYIRRVHANDTVANENNTYPDSTFTVESAGDPDLNWTIWDGNSYVKAVDYFVSNLITFRASPSTTQNEPVDQNAGSNVCLFRVHNNGTASASSVQMKINETMTDITVLADDDNTYSGAVTITDTLTSVHGSLSSGSSIDICLWADYGANPIGKYIDYNITLT